MHQTKTESIKLLDLPFEIRSQIFKDALSQSVEVAACSCVEVRKSNPFTGNCTSEGDLRRYVLDLSTPIPADRQTYHETSDIAALQPTRNTVLVLGGTRCLQIFLRNLPKQHPRTISLLLRLYVSNEWLRNCWGTEASLRYMNSMIGGLGIGTGKSFTTETMCTVLLPKEEGSDLQVMDVSVRLTMLTKL
ncbi:uncharacterized protein AB675_1939 [Cyphellophora attinorum]|uniref:Uncharacterized protein n=1 Tax=Cyphellophora attinorum TaxID=1664694 RepID=A0A0N1P2S9_9EURO|nr:uncharacterized protein AB675_1939 [Phialophora attinorum]KPI42930.1 hypothetical protein AB675_1939 [Phialophora attinorum]